MLRTLTEHRLPSRGVIGAKESASTGGRKREELPNP